MAFEKFKDFNYIFGKDRISNLPATFTKKKHKYDLLRSSLKIKKKERKSHKNCYKVD